jgi:hypothetical protein
MTTLRDPAGLPVVVAKLGLSRHVYVGNLSWDVQVYTTHTPVHPYAPLLNPLLLYYNVY